MCFLFAKLKCGARLRLLQVLLWHVESRRSLSYLRLHRRTRSRCACLRSRFGARAAMLGLIGQAMHTCPEKALQQTGKALTALSKLIPGRVHL